MRFNVLQKVEGGDYKQDYEVVCSLPLCLLDSIELSKDVEKLAKRIGPANRNNNYTFRAINVRIISYNLSTKKDNVWKKEIWPEPEGGYFPTIGLLLAMEKEILKRQKNKNFYKISMYITVLT